MIPYGPEWQFEFMTTPAKWPGNHISCALKRYRDDGTMEFGAMYFNPSKGGFQFQHDNGNLKVTVSPQLIEAMITHGWRVD